MFSNLGTGEKWKKPVHGPLRQVEGGNLLFRIELGVFFLNLMLEMKAMC